MKFPSIEGRIKWASVLVASGLVVQAASLTDVHPRSFMAFLAIGCPLALAGMVLYLWSLPRQ